ncbi:MAG TPA: hypothetical protein VJV03_03680 [Pyrinomonadaceae bacterium]|nr:hypothetical protein [Pyrinomonadaceae bacterium]
MAVPAIGFGQQTPAAPAVASNTQPVVTSPANAPQNVIASLSSLPEADMLFFINPQRILNEVIPRVLPAKDVEEMRKGFEMAKQMAGVDPTKVDYIVLAVRVKKPTGDLNFQPPEIMAVASGDFSSEALMALARMASQGKLRDEKYGSKTLGLMTIDPIVKEAQKNPLLKSFTEVGVVTLTPNSIAVGSPGYLRAAVDAGEGKERITPETLNSLVRDSNVLVSIAGRPFYAFGKAFGMHGTEVTARAPKCDTRLGDFYGALTMDATNFMLRGAINEDNPDTAKIFSNLFSGMLRYALSNINEPAVQSMAQNFVIAVEGDEVVVRADFPQQMVIEMVKKAMAPKPKTEPTATEKQKTPVRRRRPRRRAQ